MRIDCAGGMLISRKKLENVLVKLKNGKGSPDQITADVLKALPPECLEKMARSLSLMCWNMDFPEDWLCSLTVMAPKVVDATCLTKFRPIAGLCAMRKSLGLRLAQVTTSTEIRKCANCVCAGNTRRCWPVSAVEGGGTVSRVAERDCSGTTGREEGVRPCGPSSGLQGNEIARCELVLDVLDCGNLEWKLHEGMLGNSDIKQSPDEPRIASRSAGIPSHLHDDHGIGAAGLDKELDFTETGLEIGRLHAGCDLLCGRCGADCCVGVCCGNNGVRGDRKTEKCWIDSRCTKNTLDEFPEDGRQEHHGGWIGCDVGGSSGFCGIDGVSRWECKTCNRAQNSSSQQMPCKVETYVEFSMAPQIAPFEHRKNYDVAGLSMELECLDDGQGTERDKIASWSARMVANVVGVKKTACNGDGTVVETLAQDWSSLDREMQYECTGGHPRSYAQLGWTCGKDGLQRYLCEGSEMPKLTMVEMETDKLERGGKRQMVWSAPTTVQNLQMGGHGCWGGLQICWECGWSVENCPRQHGLVASCSKSRKLEAVCEMWKEPCIDGPGCLGDPSASGMTGTNAVVAWLTKERMEREKLGEYLLPPSRFQAKWNITVVLSWCCAGYGSLGSYGSWYGRRRGRWNGMSEIHSDVDWFCLTGDTKVLCWNVAGFVFVSLISNVVNLEPGMTDCFHVGELILGLQLTDDLNDLMSASATHLTVTFTWMNARTELKLPADPVLWLNSALCGGNGKTSVQKYRVIGQMDCGRAGWIQGDAVDGLQDGESLVFMSIPMAFEVALVTTSRLPHVDGDFDGGSDGVDGGFDGGFDGFDGGPVGVDGFDDNPVGFDGGFDSYDGYDGPDGFDGYDGSGDFDGCDGGLGGFKPKQRRDNCKWRSRGPQGITREWWTMP